VEFDWINNRFTCASPVAYFVPRSGASLVLAGARTGELLRAVRTLIADFAGEAHGPILQEGGPGTFLLRLDPDDAEEFCAAAGMRLELDPAIRIARALRRVCFEDVAEPGEPDDRFPRRQMHPNHGFRRLPRPEARLRGLRNAVWWVEERRRENAWVRDADQAWWRVPVREYAPFLAYAGGTFTEYNSVDRELRVLDHAALPPLHARAATLASGRLPFPEPFGRPPFAPAHTYVNVSLELKDLLLESLGASAAPLRRQ
jgi:hypothetical protein